MTQLPKTSQLEQTDTPQVSYRRLLSIGKAAKFLGVSIDTLRNWEQSGKLIPIKTPGGTRKYRSSDLKALQQADPKLRHKRTKQRNTTNGVKDTSNTSQQLYEA
jgi:transposase